MTKFSQGSQTSHNQLNADRISISNFGLPNHLLNLDKRNRLARQTISNFAKKHAAMDVGIGLAGLIIPGGGLIALAGSLIAQIPVIYKPMILQLAEIYSMPPSRVTDYVITENTALEALGQFTIMELTSEFLQEIIMEAVQEAGISALGGAIPIVGGLIAGALDAVFAATLTWRVGTTTIAFYLNGGAWVGGDREATYKIAKEIVGPLSPATSDRVDPKTIGRLQEIREKDIQSILNTIKVLQLTSPSISKEQIRAALRKMEIPVDLIDESLSLT